MPFGRGRPRVPGSNSTPTGLQEKGDEVTGSIPTTPGAPALRGDLPEEPAGLPERTLERVDPALMGACFVLVALVVYVACNPDRQNIYNHFVWQAQAFLDGRSAIPYPVSTGPVRNDYFQDVMPIAGQPGYGSLPFPPLPAVLLMPFVALWGLTTDAALLAAILGAINVGLCWRMLIRVTERRSAAVLGTVFYAFGTVAWYAAMLGSTWYLAHVVASTFLFLGITAALDAEGRERLAGAARGFLGLIDVRQFLAGLLFGLAALARLTTIFGAPFFALVGGGGTLRRRALSAGIGAAIPVAALLAYNLASSGSLFQPAYDYLRQVEYKPVPSLYHADWGIEDLRYVPQNALIMLAWPPQVPIDSAQCQGDQAPTGLGLIFDTNCAILRPDPVGMSLLLTSPAYLLAIPLAVLDRRRRLVAGAALAVLAVAFVNLMHFSQGWVQFGYRFSNDFAPFAVILVALAIARFRATWLTAGLVGLSVLVNAWGVYWGVALKW